MPQVSLEQGIHPLCLAVGLRMPYRGQVQARAQELEQLGPKSAREVAISIADDGLG